MSIDFECSECGSALSIKRMLGTTARMEPCESCIERARNEAFDEGDSKGYERGIAEAEKEEGK